jgi:hypothetical protein
VEDAKRYPQLLQKRALAKTGVAQTGQFTVRPSTGGAAHACKSARQWRQNLAESGTSWEQTGQRTSSIPHGYEHFRNQRLATCDFSQGNAERISKVQDVCGI